jgi:2-polyprenyl-3-methyl-5-hydroxy-6-metoxy-1,4-benzoquinol methylase
MIAEINSKHLTETYVEKPDYYFQITRTDLLRLLPAQTVFNHVLGVGAGGGNTLLHLKNAGIAKRVTGIELFELPGTEQQNPAIDKFIIANIEHLSAHSFGKEFDVIICGDVLEHLVDPWAVRDKLTRWLKPGGYFLASIPNIREIKTVLKILMRGTFTYEQGGIMDKTHLRFFTKKSMIELVNTGGLQVQKIVSNLAFVEESTKRRVHINNLSFKLFEEFLTRQYFILCVKK